MYRLMRWYNQNRKTIWKVIGIILLIILVLQIVNYVYSKRIEEDLKTPNNTIDNEKTYNSLTLEDNQSVVSGEELSQNQEERIEVLNLFIEYCNQQKTEEAYNLLTDECKEEMYPSIEDFKISYYDRVFGGEKKNVSIENWVDNTYKVRIMEDFLSSGSYSKENTLQDYITIERTEENKYKLNINNYIDRIEIQEEKEEKNIKIEVIKKDIYMDYITFDFKVTNNTSNQILLNDVNNIEGIYIEDSKGIKYTAYTHELSNELLTLQPNEERNIKIKYYCKYVSTKEINKVVFSDIILDYDMYTIINDMDIYNNYYEFFILI